MQRCDETDLDFFSRRAMEESHAAARAGSGSAGSAHRHMAVAYAVKMRDEQLAAQALEEMLALVSEAHKAVAIHETGDGEGGATA